MAQIMDWMLKMLPRSVIQTTAKGDQIRDARV